MHQQTKDTVRLSQQEASIPKAHYNHHHAGEKVRFVPAAQGAILKFVATPWAHGPLMGPQALLGFPRRRAPPWPHATLEPFNRVPLFRSIAMPWDPHGPFAGCRFIWPFFRKPVPDTFLINDGWNLVVTRPRAAKVWAMDQGPQPALQGSGAHRQSGQCQGRRDPTYMPRALRAQARSPEPGRRLVPREMFLAGG